MNSETTPSLRAGQLNPSPPVYWFQIIALFDSSSSLCYKATGCAIYKYYCLKFLRISWLWNVGMKSLWKNFILWKVPVFGCKSKYSYSLLLCVCYVTFDVADTVQLSYWLDNRSSSPGGDGGLPFCRRAPDRFWGPPSVLSSGYCALVPWGKVAMALP
jgi:hypothetical protein